MQNKKSFSAIHTNIAIHALFNITLVLGRMWVTNSIYTGYLIWNLFLAYIPLAISIYIARQVRINSTSIILLLCIWFVFLPNAPYLITDILHFGERTFAPRWFDVAVLFSCALNGLIMGVVSIYIVLKKIAIYFSKLQLQLVLIFICLASGFGVYIGRFLRWNSWSLVHAPLTIIKQSMQHIFLPLQHPAAWCVTLVIGATIWLIMQFVYSVARLENEEIIIKTLYK
jgi:uncharacterized membrane protein